MILENTESSLIYILRVILRRELKYRQNVILLSLKSLFDETEQLYKASSCDTSDKLKFRKICIKFECKTNLTRHRVIHIMHPSGYMR